MMLAIMESFGKQRKYFQKVNQDINVSKIHPHTTFIESYIIIGLAKREFAFNF